MQLIWLILGLPLAGVLFNAFLGGRLGKMASAVVGCAVVLGAFLIAALVMLPHVQTVSATAGYTDLTLFNWIGGDRPSGLRGHTLDVPFAIRLDPLSLTMVLVVTGVGFLIHVYSAGYMWEDDRFSRYFTYLNLFTFSMLLLVLANNYLLMFVGWEGVGLCSYLLIGFWFTKPTAAAAGKKAFLVNRVGDFGFILGVILIFIIFGTLTYSTPDRTGVFDQVVQAAGTYPVTTTVLTVITLLLLLGATGKSAQLPLYLWLPDAMEGPTPVSALIHAATMVTAGVYMIARSCALFSRAPLTEGVVVGIGIATALFAAIVAIVQYDIKRVLAYSTISQLGFMFVGVGVGAYATGIFHLVTHAFFKALLFLGAGSVMHALAGELDMRRMGGLKRWMPITFWTFAIGWIAICGIPPFAGFYSKDAILHAALGRYPVVAILGVLTAGLTAFYMSRLFFTTFFGELRLARDAETDNLDEQAHAHGHGHGHDHGHHAHEPHESPRSMWIPLAVLALLSLVGGALLNGHPWVRDHFWLADFLKPSLRWSAHTGAHHAALGATPFALISIVAAVLGIVAASTLFRSGTFARGWGSAGWARAAEARFGYDAVVHGVFIGGGRAFADILAALFDQLIIDGLVNGTAKSVGRLAQWMRSFQSGFVRSYALMVLTGTVFVILSLMLLVNQR